MLGFAKRYFRLKMGIDENADRITALEKQINLVGAYQNLMANELQLSEELEMHINRHFVEKFGVKDFDKSLHKNDVMLAHRVFYNNGDLRKALPGYFQTGYKVARNTAKIIEEQELEVNSFFDFGTGYGRVARFFPLFFKDLEIEVSEVKKQCCKFVEKQFGYKAHHHAADPAEVKFPEYDFILALSVFSHLSQDLGQRWLENLSQSLKGSGAILFTYNEIPDEEYFRYQALSEDNQFPFIEDSNQNTEEYGNAYLSQKYLQEQAKKNGLRAKFLGHQLVPSQHAVLMVKE